MAQSYQDTNISQLYIHRLTKELLNALSSVEPDQLYFVPEPEPLKQVDCNAYAPLDGEIVQHIGTTANGFTKGYVYQYTATGSVWARLNVQPQQLTLNSNTVIFTDSLGNTYQLAQKSDVVGAAPLGSILPFASSTIPQNWMLCDGSAISRTTYAELFALIGTAYGSGDGSTTFNIPDLRETLPIGAGTSTRSAIADHDTYDVGQFKDDQLQDHYHQNIYTKVGGVQYELTYYSRDTEAGSSAGSTVNGDKKFYTGGVATLYRSGTTTHGKQLGVNYIIRVLAGNEETPSEPINYNNIPIVFSQAASRGNIASGSSLSELFGKLQANYAVQNPDVIFPPYFNGSSYSHYSDFIKGILDTWYDTYGGDKMFFGYGFFSGMWLIRGYIYPGKAYGKIIIEGVVSADKLVGYYYNSVWYYTTF